MSMLFALWLACKKAPGEVSPVEPLEPAPAAATAAPAPPPPPPVPPEGIDALVRALSVRDAAPPCEEVEALNPDPVAALRYVAEQVPLPPQAGMRAGICLVERHAEATGDDLVRWVEDEHFAGLGRMVIQKLGVLPQPVAHRVARAALAGPLRDDAIDLLRASPDESLRALAP